MLTITEHSDKSRDITLLEYGHVGDEAIHSLIPPRTVLFYSNLVVPLELREEGVQLCGKRLQVV